MMFDRFGGGKTCFTTMEWMVFPYSSETSVISKQRLLTKLAASKAVERANQRDQFCENLTGNV